MHLKYCSFLFLHTFFFPPASRSSCLFLTSYYPASSFFRVSTPAIAYALAEYSGKQNYRGNKDCENKITCDLGLSAFSTSNLNLYSNPLHLSSTNNLFSPKVANISNYNKGILTDSLSFLNILPSNTLRNMSTSTTVSSAPSSTTTAVAEKENVSHIILKPQKIFKEKYRLDYKVTDFVIEHIDIKFELSDKSTKVSSTLHMHRRDTSSGSSLASIEDLSDLKLDGEDLKLLKLKINDQEIAYGMSDASASNNTINENGNISKGYIFDEDGNNLIINKKLLPVNASDKFKVYTEVYISPIDNSQLMGLYKTGQFFCTQCEAEGFRRITYFLDRPDVMATYNVTIECEKSMCPVMLSNGNLIKKGEIKNEDGKSTSRHFAVFSDPHPKPSYLFALVAGDLKSLKDSYTTKSNRKVHLEILAEEEDVDKLDWAMYSIKKAMEWDENTFNLEYDLDNFYIVCTRDFNMGAMENKGLNVFNSALLLANEKTTTDAEYERILGVVGHEYFHNWTGDRVTCRDWFQLTLKEGLTVYRDQRFTSDMYSHAAKRIEDVKFLRSVQFKEDSGPMSHPIRPESYIAMDNFYTATVYDKGAEVIRMYATILGEDGFKKGMDLYFKRHDGHAVTCEDFRFAMADSNQYDLTQFERWYLQAGTPEVEVLESEYLSDKKTYRIAFSQNTPATPKQPIKLPLHIPIRIGLIGKQSKKDLVDYNTILHLKEEKQTFEIPDVTEDCIPSILRDFSAPVKLKNKFESDEDLSFLMAYDSDDFNKWEAGEKLKVKIILERVNVFKKIFDEKYQLKQKDVKAIKEEEEEIDNDFDIYDNLDKYFKEEVAAGRESNDKMISTLFLNSMKTALLDENQDMELRSYAFSLPSVDTISNEIRSFDPLIIKFAIKSVRNEIYNKLKDEIWSIYNKLTMSDDYEEKIEKKDIARRALRNVLLNYVTSNEDESSIQIAYKHYIKAKNMTDKLAAFRCVTAIKSKERDEAIRDFYKFAEGDPLTLDKWFAIQAMSESADCFDDIVELSKHPEFTMKNPNRYRALFMSFARNIRNFNRKDGKGYKFLADSIIQLDKLNPQIAARACSFLIHGNKMDEKFRNQMKKQLERIYQTPGLSNDTHEICAKALTTE